MTEDGQTGIGRHLPTLAIVLVLAAMFFTIRIQNTEHLVTNDEPFWLGRSANFYRALVHRDFASTYQMAHPGVPVMWAGTIAFWLHAPEYAHPDPGNSNWPFFIDDRLVVAEIDPLTILQQARVIKLLMETALFAVAIGIIAMLGSRMLATISGVLIVLDPFLAGFGPLLHVDSLFAISLFTASLAIAWAFSDRVSGRARLWVCLLAGGLAAIAVLTRATGLVIVMPLLIGALLLWQNRRPNPGLVIGSIGAWPIGFAMVFTLAWPAVWVMPITTAREIIDWTLGAASDGHEHVLFFNGAIHQGDPGFWFYPVTLLWRTTPIVWIGLAAFLISLRSSEVRRRVLSFLPVLVLGAAVFLIMTIGAKKFDRYILPTYPVMALIAAIGFDSAIVSLQHRMPTVKRWLAPVVITSIALAGVWSMSNAGPYRLNYYNEVMRAFRQPEQVLQIGWGEGGSEVVEYLEAESERLGRPVSVQTFSIPQGRFQPPLKYHMIEDGMQTDSIQYRTPGLTDPEDWQKTDYYVFNIQQTQRGMAPDYVYFADYEPVHTVVIAGVTIWEIYAPSQLPPAESGP